MGRKWNNMNLEKIDFVWIAAILALFVVCIFLSNERNSLSAEITSLKNDQKVAEKLYMIDLQERVEFNSRASWDLNVWQERANHYKERRYNTMLEFDDLVLSMIVRQQEDCLKRLYDLKTAGETTNLHKEIDVCNEVENSIDKRLLEIVKKRGVE